jgi:hypothetical protein
LNHIWCFTGDYFDDTPWLPMVLMKAERLGVCETVVYDYQDRGDSLVKAMTPVAIKRKKNGYLLLIRLLQEEIRIIQGGEVNCSNMQVLSSIDMKNDARDKIISWYRMLISHDAMALLTNTAIFDPESSREDLDRLRGLKVFPLSYYKTVSINNRKVRLFNRFPLLMMKLLKLKSK